MFDYFKKNIVKIIGLALAISAVIIVYTVLTYKPMYESRVSMLIPTQEITSNLVISEGEANMIPSDVIFSRSSLNNYVAIATSDTVLEKSLEQTSIELELKAFKNKIDVDIMSGTHIIEVVVKTDDSKTSYELVKAVEEKFKEKVVEIYEIDSIKTIDEAKEQEDPIEKNLVQQLAIILVATTTISFFTAFFIYSFKENK